MTRKQQRLYAVILILAGAAVAAALSLFALRDNVTFFHSPSEVAAGAAPPGRSFRLGGLVMYGTVEKDGTRTAFVVTDNVNDIDVVYDGIVPALFREGKGVVAVGRLNADGSFPASQLLAKHDENYMPPEVARALEKPAP